MVEQLALNSSYQQQGDLVTLYLRPDFNYLLKDNAQEQIETALCSVLDQPINLSIEMSDEGITPLELRRNLYQDKLKQASASIMNDSNVTFLQQRFAAKVDMDSIRPK